METDPYWFPEDRNRLATAATIYRDGRVRCDTAGMYHVTGSGSPKTAKIYQIDKECSCDFARKNGRTKWCQHLIATVIYRKMLAPFRNDVEPSLFAAPKTVEERLAQPPSSPEEEWPEEEPYPPRSFDDAFPQAVAAEARRRGHAFMAPSEPPQDTITPEDREGDTPVPDTLVEALEEPVPVAKKKRPSIPQRFIQDIKGKQHVKFAGLVLAAQEDGLVSLTADWTFNDEKLSLAHAIATFTDGRRYEDSGDATEANVTSMVKSHFRRVALTRAKARCLRDALGIEAASVEELAEEGDSHPVPDLIPQIKAVMQQLGFAGQTVAHAQAQIKQWTNLPFDREMTANHEAILTALKTRLANNERSL
jgi:hypothetical protein